MSGKMNLLRENSLRLAKLMLIAIQASCVSAGGSSSFQDDIQDFEEYEWYLYIYNPKSSDVADLNPVLESKIVPKDSEFNLPLKGAKFSCSLSKMLSDRNRSLDCEGFYLALDCADGSRVLPHLEDITIVSQAISRF